MRCAHCGHNNPPDARHCNRCGASVGASARGADAAFAPPMGTSRSMPVVPPGATMPPGAIPQVPEGASEQERKHVTVMFADVKGSMDLAHSMDVEQWWAIMQRFFTLLTEGITRYDGLVADFTGDGVMAVFGAPVALEDHARRACHAALWLRDALGALAEELRRDEGVSFAVRMGLNSGEVVAGTIGSERGEEYALIGHTAGVAQRMESLAEPGGIFMTEATASLVRGFFELREHAAAEVKGVEGPVGIFELIGGEGPQSAFE